MDAIFPTIRDAIVEGWGGLLRSPLSGQSHLYWVYLISCLAIAAWSYRHYYYAPRDGGPGGLRAFLRFCFPKEVYLHPSARVDYQIFLANALSAFFLRSVQLFGTTVLAVAAYKGLVAVLGPPAPDRAWATGSIVAGTLLIALATDFASYFIHMLSHRVPALWEIHRVHHTAEVLTPITIFRKHPFYDVLGSWTTTPLRSLAQGAIAYLFIEDLTPLTIFGGNILYTVFRFAGANLRHTHIWFHWGPVLGRVFISPAQHQIHHSVDPRHRDRNFGEILALWDWAFGSLYLPREREELVFGVAEGVPQEHPSLAAAYFLPVRNLWRMLMGKQTLQPGAEAAKKAAVEPGS